MKVAVGDSIPEWVMDSVSPDRMRTMAALLQDPNPLHWDRDLGTFWTTLHLSYEKEIDALLSIPDTHAQVALIPIAFTRGADFQPAPRKDLDKLVYTNSR